MIGRHADAVEYFIEHPEAPLDPVLRAYIDSIRLRLDEDGAIAMQTPLN